VLAVLLAAQLCFWYQTHNVLPDMAVVEDVPGKAAVDALSLGDTQFYFRVLVLELQNMGDTYGRFTPLFKYDYDKLTQWFYLLDSLDNRSDLLPTLASYYYSQTQHHEDVRYLVDYLYHYAADRPEQKWWWLVQASYLAGHRLNDQDLALRVAEPLTRAHAIPVWAQQMPAFIHEQRGEYKDALVIMENILKDVDHIPPNELKFMRYFIEERIHSMDQRVKEQIDTKEKKEGKAQP
jgi:hypothetical protein